MGKREDIFKCINSMDNVYTIKNLEAFKIGNIIGQRIDVLIIDTKYQNTVELSKFILSILPNITIGGVTSLKIFYCDNLGE